MENIWPSSESVPSAAASSLKRMQSAVAIASGLAMSGRAVDLAGLESVAGLLCAQVLDLSFEDGRALRPAIVALNESVTGLMTMLARPAH